MISRFRPVRIAVLFLLFEASRVAHAQPTPSVAPPIPSSAAVPTTRQLPFVSPVFGDNMVLQRGKPNTIWGWSEPGDNVKVEIGDSSAIGVAGSDHRWQVKIQPPPEGGPYTAKITGHDSVELHCAVANRTWACRSGSR
jgi:hypothetical protein